MWMVTGLAVGLFIAFLVFLGTHERPGKVAPAVAKESPAKPKEKSAEKPAAGAETAKLPTQAPTAANQAKAPEQKPINYDFYKKLEKFEVKVPDAKEGTRPKTATSPRGYLLQAGAFKSAGEADARKAQLALLGIVSSIQVVTPEGKAAYHRVNVGPYRDLDRVKQVRQTLTENHIDSVILPQ
jgi:cell division protein FtsN